MKYFILQHEYQTGFIDGDVEFVPPLAGYYQMGLPVDIRDVKIHVKMDKAVRKLKADFFLTTSGAFFASEKLASLIHDFQNDTQIEKCETHYHNGKSTEKTYFLIHTNKKIDCFDYQKSEYAGKPLALSRLERGENPDSFTIKNIKSLAIDKQKAGDATFFFVKNIIMIDPVIASPLAEAIQSASLFVNLIPLVNI
nr:hypothetical protein HUO10_006521 [Paraburkholderia busanensis]